MARRSRWIESCGQVYAALAPVSSTVGPERAEALRVHLSRRSGALSAGGRSLLSTAQRAKQTPRVERGESAARDAARGRCESGLRSRRTDTPRRTAVLAFSWQSNFGRSCCTPGAMQCGTMSSTSILALSASILHASRGANSVWKRYHVAEVLRAVVQPSPSVTMLRAHDRCKHHAQQCEQCLT